MKTCKFLFSLLPCLLLLGCTSSRQSDARWNLDENDMVMAQAQDHIAFSYRSPATVERDGKQYRRVNFAVDVPVGLQYFEANEGTDFGFYYKGGEVICVKTDPTGLKHEEDGVREAQGGDFASMVSGGFATSHHKKWDVNKMKPRNWRKNVMVEKDGVTVCFYNIKPKHIPGYWEMVRNTLRVLGAGNK